MICLLRVRGNVAEELLVFCYAVRIIDGVVYGEHCSFSIS